ncbi:MAG TPA: hypothetical protein VLN57_10250 [Xanthobacteraceae bacterium]|nr:hypothetical protein [Xanthobacteraceae bacterium]
MASLLKPWRAKLHLDPRTPHLQPPHAIALMCVPPARKTNVDGTP